MSQKCMNYNYNLFQQYMNDVLWNFLNDFCQVYLYDILIYSKT